MLQKFKESYAHLLDVPIAAFEQTGFVLYKTEKRNEPEWASWIQMIWFFSIDTVLVCSVAPEYAKQAETIFEKCRSHPLLSETWLAQAQSITDGQEWVQCELFYYPTQNPPLPMSQYTVERLRPGEPEADRLLRNFDGGVYVISDANGKLASHAAVKKKGLLREIAVGTQPEYRQQGMGRAVVAYAVQEILAQGYVPTYWPDSLHNKASYALAYSVGFVKIAEMLFCAYERPGWSGFAV